jgi:Proliferating cell nuclear antigen, N-terminal domain
MKTKNEGRHILLPAKTCQNLLLCKNADEYSKYTSATTCCNGPVFPYENMIEATLSGSLLKKVIEAVRELLGDAVFECDETGITMQVSAVHSHLTYFMSVNLNQFRIARRPWTRPTYLYVHYILR